jgi:2-polyprenyl-6-methoxyphenol hydroxylase-like FAD-dependent oxidoreductase
MQDAVVLANCLYDIEEATQENIEAALADYRAQRVGHVTVQVNMSKMMGRAMFGQVKLLGDHEKLSCCETILFVSRTAEKVFVFSVA